MLPRGGLWLQRLRIAVDGAIPAQMVYHGACMNHGRRSIMSESPPLPLHADDPAARIYVYADGPDGNGIVVSLLTALAYVPPSVAVSLAGTWGEFARIVPKDAAACREKMRAAATWTSWGAYRDAYVAQGGPPRPSGGTGNGEAVRPAGSAPPDAVIRAAYEALDWRTQREPLVGDDIDLESMVVAGWDRRNSMHDPYRAMGYDLPAPIINAFVRSYCTGDSLASMYALKPCAFDESLGRAFARIGCLLIRDDALLGGFWDGIATIEEAERILTGYRDRLDELRASVPESDPNALPFDDPHLFDDIVADPYGENIDEEEDDDA